MKRGKGRTSFLVGCLGALGAVAMGCGSGATPGLPEENVGQVSQAETVEFTPGSFIDRDAFIDSASLSRLPSDLPAALSDLNDKLAILSKIPGYVSTAIWALQFLDVVDSPEDIMNQRFEAIHTHLDNLGFQINISQVTADRDDRLASMQTAINVVERFSQRSNGPINESLLTPVEQVELGTELARSQEVTQQAGSPSAFKHLFVESLTAGEWKNFISYRPGLTPGLVNTLDNSVFDWRWGLAQYVFLISQRLAILALTDPDFKVSGEHDEELGQYRSRLSELHTQISDGVRCVRDRWTTSTVICADIYTGLSTKTAFQDARCWGSTYSPAACDALMATYENRNRRVLMTYMPLFEVRAMLDQLTLIIDDVPDLAQESNKIQLRDWQSREGCISRTPMYEYETDPYSPTLIPGVWGTELTSCATVPEQRWVYDRADKTIRDEAGNCLMPQRDELDDFLVVQPCSGRRSEHWTYDPLNGTIENAFHAVITAPPWPWEPGTQWMDVQVKGAKPNQSWQSAPALVLDSPFGDDPVDVYVGSDPNYGYSQWLAWQDYFTGECWWDYLGDYNGLPTDLHVRGGWGEDWMIPAPDGGTTFCDYELVPPIAAGRKIFLEGQGGNDFMWVDGSNVAPTVAMGGEGDDMLITVTDGGETSVLGGPGNDRLIALGNAGYGYFSGEQGNDCLWLEGSGLGRDSCGTGTADQWGGATTKPLDCEQTTTSCW